jgi:DNA-binding MarR family transcriptional regulator
MKPRNGRRGATAPAAAPGALGATRTAGRERGPAPGPAEGEPPLSLGPLRGYLGYRLRQAQAASFRHLDRAPGAVGDLSPGRFSLLTVIEANPAVTQTRIARAFGIDKSTLSPVVDHLVKRGLLARRRSRTDGRAYGLTLTAAGARALAATRARIEAQERLLRDALSAREYGALMAMLDRLVAALEADACG